MTYKGTEDNKFKSINAKEKGENRKGRKETKRYPSDFLCALCVERFCLFLLDEGKKNLKTAETSHKITESTEIQDIAVLDALTHQVST